MVAIEQQQPIVRVISTHLQAINIPEEVEVASPSAFESRGYASLPECLVLVLAGSSPEAMFGFVRALRQQFSGCVLLVGPATDAKLILRAMQAGVDRFLDEEDPIGGLDSALNWLQSRSKIRAPSQLLAVLGAAGGCGSSTIAVNIAALVAKQSGRCNLIDLNPGKADLAPLLDLKPSYTLADLCRNDNRLDRSMYEKLLVAHPSGISLLSAPREFAEVGTVTPEGVARAVVVAREVFSTVVVDLEDCFHVEQFAVIEQATRILLVCRLDFTAVRNTRRILDHLVANGIPADRVEVVVNHHGTPGELPLEEAEIAIGRAVKFFIPTDPETVSTAGNLGTPAALTRPLAPVVQSIARLVGLDTPAAGRSPLSRVFAKARESVTRPFRSLASRLRRPTSAANAPLPEFEVRHA